MNNECLQVKLKKKTVSDLKTTGEGVSGLGLQYFEGKLQFNLIYLQIRFRNIKKRFILMFSCLQTTSFTSLGRKQHPRIPFTLIQRFFQVVSVVSFKPEVNKASYEPIRERKGVNPDTSGRKHIFDP